MSEVKGEYKMDRATDPQGNIANRSDDDTVLTCEASTSYDGKMMMQDVWLLDSGATYHMASRKEWFHHYEPVSGGVVYSCSDHAMNVVGIGSIKLKMYDGIVRTIQ